MQPTSRTFPLVGLPARLVLSYVISVLGAIPVLGQPAGGLEEGNARPSEFIEGRELRWAAHKTAVKERFTSKKRSLLGPIEKLEVGTQTPEGADHLLVIFRDEFVPDWKGGEILNFCGYLEGASWRPRVPDALFEESMRLWVYWENQLGRRLRSPLTEFMVWAKGDKQLKDLKRDLENFACVDQVIYRRSALSNAEGRLEPVARPEDGGRELSTKTAGRWWLERIGVETTWKDWAVAGEYVNVGLIVDGAVGVGSEIPSVSYVGDPNSFAFPGSEVDRANVRALAEPLTGSLDNPVGGVAFKSRVFLTSDLRCDITRGPNEFGPDPCGPNTVITFWQDYAIKALGAAVGPGGVVIVPKTVPDGLNENGIAVRSSVPVTTDFLTMKAVNELSEGGVIVVIAAGDSQTNLTHLATWPNIRDSQSILVGGGREANNVGQNCRNVNECQSLFVQLLPTDPEVNQDLNEIHTVVVGGMAALAQSWYVRNDILNGLPARAFLGYNDFRSINLWDFPDTLRSVPRILQERPHPSLDYIHFFEPFPSLKILQDNVLNIGVKTPGEELGATVLVFNDSDEPAQLRDWQTYVRAGPDLDAFELALPPSILTGLSGQRFDVKVLTDEPGQYHAAVDYAVDPEDDPELRDGFEASATVVTAPYPIAELRTNHYRLLIPDANNEIHLDHGLRQVPGNPIALDKPDSIRMIRVLNRGGEDLLVTPQLSGSDDHEFLYAWKWRPPQDPAFLGQERIKPGEEEFLFTRYLGTEVGRHEATLLLSTNDPSAAQFRVVLEGQTFEENRLTIHSLSEFQQAVMRDRTGGVLPLSPALEAVLDFGTLTQDEWSQLVSGPAVAVMSLGGILLERGIMVTVGTLGWVVVKGPEAIEALQDGRVTMDFNALGPGAFVTYYDFVVPELENAAARLWIVGAIRTPVPNVAVIGPAPSDGALVGQPGQKSGNAVQSGDSIHLGTTGPGQRVEAELTIRNDRQSQIFIEDLSVGIDAFDISVDERALGPGASTTLRVGFRALSQAEGSASTPAGFRVVDASGADHYFGLELTASISADGGNDDPVPGPGPTGPGTVFLVEECSGATFAHGRTGVVDFAEIPPCTSDPQRPLTLNIHVEGQASEVGFYFSKRSDVPAYFRSEVFLPTNPVIAPGGLQPVGLFFGEGRTIIPRTAELTVIYRPEGSSPALPHEEFSVELRDGPPRVPADSLAISLTAAASGESIDVKPRGQETPTPFNLGTTGQCVWLNQTLLLRNDEADEIELLELTAGLLGDDRRYYRHIALERQAWPRSLAPGDVAEFQVGFLPTPSGGTLPIPCPGWPPVEPVPIYGAYLVYSGSGPEPELKEFELSVEGTYLPGAPGLEIEIEGGFVAPAPPNVFRGVDAYPQSLASGSTVWIPRLEPGEQHFLEMTVSNPSGSEELMGILLLEGGTESSWRAVSRWSSETDSMETGQEWTDLDFRIPPHGEVRYVLRYTSDGGSVGSREGLTVDVNDGNSPFRVFLEESYLEHIAVPSASNDLVRILEGQSVSIAVLANDSSGLVLMGVTTPADHGSSMKSGSFVGYVPNVGFVGTDRFEYSAVDEYGAVVRAWVTVEVVPNQEPPVAQPDTKDVEAHRDRLLFVTANDYDPDGFHVWLTSDAIVAPPDNGTAVRVDGQMIRYVPDPLFVGTDRFQYRITDGYGSTFTDEAWVTVHVVDHNQDPVAVPDFDKTWIDEAVTIEVVANDYDPDDVDIALAPDWLASAPAHGSVSKASSTAIRYTPGASDTGADPLTDSFSYRLVDPWGKASVGSVQVELISRLLDSAFYMPPRAAADAVAVVTNSGPALTFEVLGNDFLASGDPLIVSSFNPGELRGQLTLSGSTFTYWPEPHFEGVESFEYTADSSIGNSGTATVSIHNYKVRLEYIAYPDEQGDGTPIPQVAPIAHPDSYILVRDTVSLFDVLANDEDDNGDSLSVTAIPSAPSFGDVEIVGGSHVRYTPLPGYEGNDSFLYEVSDGAGNSAIGVVDVEIPSASSPPKAWPDSATTLEDTSVVIAVLDNDRDWDGDPLRPASIPTPPSNGTATILADGRIRYQPSPNWFGSDSFEYAATDDDEGESAPAAVSVAVTSVNDAPVLAADAATTLEGNTVTIAVLANDSDPEGDPLKVVSAGNAGHGSVVIASSGAALVYSPAPGFFGVDTFTYKVDDGNRLPGQSAFGPATVTVTVEKDNHPPVVLNDTIVCLEDQAKGFFDYYLLGDDSDPDGDSLSIIGMTDPSHGELFKDADLTSFTYRSDLNWCGLDSVQYTVGDGYGGTATGVLRFHVNCSNDAPVAGDDSFSVYENEQITLTAAQILGNDTDVEGDPLSIDAVGTPSMPGSAAVLLADGNVRYTPASGFFGEDTFTYTVSDSDRQDTGLIQVSVLEDLSPTAAYTYVCTGRSCMFDASSSSDDRGIFRYEWKFGTSYYDLGYGQQISWTFDTGGTRSVKLTVTDSVGQVAYKSRQVTVTEPPPDAVDDFIRGFSSYNRTIEFSDLLANDSDPGGDSLQVVSVGTPSMGSLDCPQGEDYCVYDPPGSYYTATFTYTITDGNGENDTATVTVYYP